MREFLVGIIIVLGLTAGGYWWYQSLALPEARIERFQGVAVDPATLQGYRRIAAVQFDELFFADPLFRALEPMAPERQATSTLFGRPNPFAPF